jgi:putative phage-type endonuclease
MARELTITARDFAIILGLNEYESCFKLLEKKIEKKHPFFGNKFCDHGNKHEPTAIKLYEKKMDIKINKCVNTSHPKYKYIVGRPDGVTENNCIIEVKCPWTNRRSSGDVAISDSYYSQIQVYLEIFNVEIAHYVEYFTKEGKEDVFTIIPIVRDRKWFNKVIPIIDKFYQEMKKYQEIGDLERHPVRIAITKWEEKYYTP